MSPVLCGQGSVLRSLNTKMHPSGCFFIASRYKKPGPIRISDLSEKFVFQQTDFDISVVFSMIGGLDFP